MRNLVLNLLSSTSITHFRAKLEEIQKRETISRHIFYVLVIAVLFQYQQRSCLLLGLFSQLVFQHGCNVANFWQLFQLIKSILMEKRNFLSSYKSKKVKKHIKPLNVTAFLSIFILLNFQFNLPLLKSLFNWRNSTIFL